MQGQQHSYMLCCHRAETSCRAGTWHTPGWSVSNDLAPRWRAANASTDKGILSHETLDNCRDVGELPLSGFQQQI